MQFKPEQTFADVERLARAGRLQEAFGLMVALAERDEPLALFTLANFFWQGGPVDRDIVKAHSLFVRASAAGHADAHAFVTNLLGNGVLGERDWRQALERLKVEANVDPYRRLALQVLQAMGVDSEGNPASLPTGKPLSDKLDVAIFPALFSASECDLVLAAAEQRYQPSTIHEANGREVPHPLRSSTGAPLHWLIEDPALHALNRRLAAITGTMYEQAEPMLVLRYAPGQQYRPHLDALPGVANQRIVTALVYLDDLYQGGETEFPHLGLKVKGERGDVLIFRNLAADGTAEPLSEHAGLPVISGVKHVASRWIRQESMIPPTS
ncbi:MAG TPA: 2OG-Fe(II) oxygenase [Sphingobium sp.]|nr:2OG-Fe(II) oxygenase [Sphingobium sp.]